MHPYPHLYRVTAAAAAAGNIQLVSGRLAPLRSDSPAEFDGPGDLWSPETLLVGAVGDCFILTFRAIARASGLPWVSLTCDVAGTLERIDHVTQFTRFDVTARLTVDAAGDADHARRLLEKAERDCLITNSLKGEVHFDAVIDVAPAAAGAISG
jgi:organic hydroperoxide reductase OsmC/OhrA